MLKELKTSTMKKLLPQRKEDSHKGQNGRVLIVGGSVDYYGAPVLAGLGALYSGSDLVYLYVPECNFDAARSLYPDFVVRKFSGDYLGMEAVEEIVEFGKKRADSLLIGPGMTEQGVDAAQKIVEKLHLPTVLDADAIDILKKIEKFPLQQKLVVTPHMNEFRNLVDRDVVVKADDSKSIILLRSIAMDLHINVLLKGATDFVASEEGYVELNKTGNAGMTVGGTGDVLAGVVASFLARGLEGYDAARLAAYYVGRAGDLLKKEKGYQFSASDLALKLPYAIWDF